MTSQWQRPLDMPGGTSWHTTRREDEGALHHKLVIALDALLVSTLILIGFAVHW